MEEHVTINMEALTAAITACESPRGPVEAQQIDLTRYQGGVVRIYLSEDLKLTVNPRRADQYWQLAEFYLPWPVHDDEEVPE